MDIDENIVDIIKKIVHNGDRAEIVPAKDGVKIYVAKRREYKSNKNPDQNEDDDD